MRAHLLRKILYAEDEPDIQAIARISLEMIGGFEVHLCNNGDEVLAAAAEFSPDLILLDVMMPGMDGPQTLQALRTSTEHPDIPVVFVTAKVLGSDVETWRGLGATDVIAKPFDPMQLPKQIQGIWDRLHDSD